MHFDEAFDLYGAATDLRSTPCVTHRDCRDLSVKEVLERLHVASRKPPRKRRRLSNPIWAVACRRRRRSGSRRRASHDHAQRRRRDHWRGQGSRGGRGRSGRVRQAPRRLRHRRIQRRARRHARDHAQPPHLALPRRARRPPHPRPRRSGRFFDPGLLRVQVGQVRHGPLRDPSTIHCLASTASSPSPQRVRRRHAVARSSVPFTLAAQRAAASPEAKVKPL
mmetsp:Transcript_73/g.254  ORF Transcript_73/g.254 Transcript_73/m.254 type:complete len:222 (+) Transcript_73:448-1113(+)